MARSEFQQPSAASSVSNRATGACHCAKTVSMISSIILSAGADAIEPGRG